MCVLMVFAEWVGFFFPPEEFPKGFRAVFPGMGGGGLPGMGLILDVNAGVFFFSSHFRLLSSFLGMGRARSFASPLCGSLRRFALIG